MGEEGTSRASTLVDDHGKREPADRLVDAGHDHHHQVLAMLHVHLDHDLCLEVMALRGKPRTSVTSGTADRPQGRQARSTGDELGDRVRSGAEKGEAVTRPRVLSVVGVFLGLGAAAVRAEDPRAQKADGKKEAKPAFEEHVTVVGRPIVEATEIDTYAGPVTTVTEDQVRDLNAQDVDSALRRVPGVVISRYNPVGNYGGGDGGALFIRGMGSGRPGAEISTMVDGIPKFVGVWTHPLLDTLSISISPGRSKSTGAPSPCSWATWPSAR